MIGFPFGRRRKPTAAPGFRFDTIGEIALDDVAGETGHVGALVAALPPDAVGYVEFAPPGPVTLAPWFMAGGNGRDLYAYRASRIPPVRIYRFTGSTGLYGRGLILRGDTLVRLDDFKFDQLGHASDPFHAGVLHAHDDGLRLWRPEAERTIEGPCLLLAQPGEDVWGHWLVDLLPRLAIARLVPIGFRMILDAAAPAWADSLLAHAGVAPDRIVRHDAGREILRVRDLYLPTFLRRGNAVSPLANLAWPMGRPRAPARRLYVSRAGHRLGSSIVNHVEIETRVRSRGYEVVRTETLGLAGGIALFAGASHVIGEFGSGMHNTVFSPAGTRVAVLQSPGVTSFVQAGIGQVRAQPTGFAFGETADAPRRMHLAPALLDEVLDQLDA